MKNTERCGISLMNQDGSINKRVVKKENIYHAVVVRVVENKDLDRVEDVRKMVFSFASITMLDCNFQTKFSEDELKRFQDFFKIHLTEKRFDQKLLFKEFRKLFKEYC